jgi:hypothetical protein
MSSENHSRFIQYLQKAVKVINYSKDWEKGSEVQGMVSLRNSLSWTIRRDICFTRGGFGNTTKWSAI